MMLLIWYLVLPAALFPYYSAGFDNPNAARIFGLVGCGNVDVDALLSQAINMVTNAQNKITSIYNALVISPGQLTPDSRAANYAKSMFGITFQWGKHLSNDAITFLNGVSQNYGQVLAALQNPGPARSYLICDNSVLQYTSNFADLGPVGPGSQAQFQARWLDSTFTDNKGQITPYFDFVNCYELAEGAQQTARVNPDNYRIFVEMCHINTRWAGTPA